MNDTTYEHEHVHEHEQEQEQASKPSNAGGFMAGMVIGGLAGAGTMLLLAPQSGKRTRADIQKKGADIQQKGIELRDQTVENVENKMAQARVKAREITAPAVRQAKVLQHRGQEILDEQRDRLSIGADQVLAK